MDITLVQSNGMQAQAGTGGAAHVFSSATSSVPVTKSDSTAVTCKCLYVGGAGDVTIKHKSEGAAVTYSGVQAGSFLPLMLNSGKVMSTGTTATSIVAMDY